jgi:hypothetical protein
MTNETKDTRSIRKNKQWLRSRDQRKHPKLFSVDMVQLKDGSFHILGGGARVKVKTNSKSYKEYLVDVRDLACEMRTIGIRSF